MNFANWSDSWEADLWDTLTSCWQQLPCLLGDSPSLRGLGPRSRSPPAPVGLDHPWAAPHWIQLQLSCSGPPHRLQGESQPSVSRSTECSRQLCPYCFPTVYKHVYAKQIQCHEALSFFFLLPHLIPTILYSLKWEFNGWFCPPLGQHNLHTHKNISFDWYSVFLVTPRYMPFQLYSSSTCMLLCCALE